MDGEITLPTEHFIAEGLLRQVTEFDIERHAAHLLRERLQHLVEQVFLAPFALGINAFAHHPAMHEKEWG